jgi:hypothetical protein
MFFCKEKNYPMISLQSLEGFSEDKQSQQCFTRRFYPLSIGCVVLLLCFGACLLIPIFKEQGDAVPLIYVVLGGVSFMVCIVLFVITWRRMVGAVPICQQSGQPMEVYQLEDTLKEGKYELVYLCRQSRTFFRVVYGTTD